MQETEKIKYIVTPTLEEQLQVLQLLEDNGYMWPNGQLPTQYVPLKELSHKCTVIYIKETYQTVTKRVQTGRVENIDPMDTDLSEVTIQELRYQFRPSKLLL